MPLRDGQHNPQDRQTFEAIFINKFKLTLNRNKEVKYILQKFTFSIMNHYFKSKPWPPHLSSISTSSALYYL